MTSNRIYSIDSFKVFGSFLIVAFHLHIFEDVSASWFMIFDKSIRFVVPFFFISSGFLFGRKLLFKSVQPIPVALNMVKKFLLLFVVWTIIYSCVIVLYYYVIPFIKTGDIVKLTSIMVDFKSYLHIDPFNAPLRGGIGSLWFLTALSLSLLIVSYFVQHNLTMYMFPFSIILFVCALLNGVYRETILGIDLPLDPRYGIWFSMFFITIGYHLSHITIQRQFSLGLPMTLIYLGICFTYVEYSFVYNNYPGEFWNKFVIGTVPLSIGIFLLALSFPNFGRNTLAPLGQLTLGVYVSHQLLREFVKPISNIFDGLSGEIIYPMVTFVVSVLFTISLKKIKFARFLVS